MSTKPSHLQGGLAILVPQIWVGTMLQQFPNGISLPAHCRLVQRRIPKIASDVDLGSTG
jgi:hypothetical protein